MSGPGMYRVEIAESVTDTGDGHRMVEAALTAESAEEAARAVVEKHLPDAWPVHLRASLVEWGKPREVGYFVTLGPGIVERCRPEAFDLALLLTFRNEQLRRHREDGRD